MASRQPAPMAVKRAKGKHRIAVYTPTATIHKQGAVAVTVKGDADIVPACHHRA